MANYRGWEHLMTADGLTEKERAVNALKEAFENQVIDNPGYEAEAKRNGVIQPMLITRGEVRYKANITAMPGDELYPGDMVEAFGEMWIVIETRAIDTVQVTGMMWLCNYNFKWQNFSPAILSSYGVFDSGVYSTTKNGDEQLQYLDKQYKIYLPYNDNTAKLFVDKRLAIGKTYDAYGKNILSVYSITGNDAVSRSYGSGAHLLILNVRSSAYNASTDNFELEICNYIAGEEPVPPSPSPEGEIKCSIIGSTTIKAGRQKVYKAEFYDEHGEVVADVDPLWETEDVPGEFITDVDDNLIIEIDKGIFVGTTFEIKLTDLEGHYPETTMKVEVI